MSDKFSASLQENLITLLAYDDDAGKLVANLADINLFEGDYRTVADRCVKYWRVHNSAPKDHLPDLFDDFLDDVKNKKAPTIRRILSNMLGLSERINTKYVLDKLRAFTRLQKMSGAIMQSYETISKHKELGIKEVEELWDKLLRAREIDFDSGLRLYEIDKVLNYFNSHFMEFKCGIKELDDNYIVPYRGGVLLFLGASGAGKSWFLIQIGKHAFLQRKRILHVTLEMGAEEVAQRYYQSFFACSKRNAKTKLAVLELDNFNRLEGLGQEELDVDFTLESKVAREELETRVTKLGTRIENLIIKRFPTRNLTVSQLAAYLDSLEVAENFIPDLLILDYIGIMNTDQSNHRISLGRTYESLRGLAVERNIACVTAHQISKRGAMAITAGSTDVAEDWSLIASSDQVITFSATDEEKAFGLGRIFVSKARSEKDKFGILLTQNYDIGQFCLNSVMLDNKYFDIFKDTVGEYVEGDEGEEDDDDD